MAGALMEDRLALMARAERAILHLLAQAKAITAAPQIQILLHTPMVVAAAVPVRLGETPQTQMAAMAVLAQPHQFLGRLLLMLEVVAVEQKAEELQELEVPAVAVMDRLAELELLVQPTLVVEAEEHRERAQQADQAL